jgi:hypothetical protein
MWLVYYRNTKSCALFWGFQLCEIGLVHQESCVVTLSAVFGIHDEWPACYPIKAVALPVAARHAVYGAVDDAFADL